MLDFRQIRGVGIERFVECSGQGGLNLLAGRLLQAVPMAVGRVNGLLPQFGLAMNQLFGARHDQLRHAVDRLELRVARCADHFEAANQFVRSTLVDFAQQFDFHPIDAVLNEHQHDREAERDGRGIERDVQAGQQARHGALQAVAAIGRLRAQAGAQVAERGRDSSDEEPVGACER